MADKINKITNANAENRADKSTEATVPLKKKRKQSATAKQRPPPEEKYRTAETARRLSQKTWKNCHSLQSNFCRS